MRQRMRPAGFQAHRKQIRIGHCPTPCAVIVSTSLSAGRRTTRHLSPCTVPASTTAFSGALLEGLLAYGRQPTPVKCAALKSMAPRMTEPTAVSSSAGATLRCAGIAAGLFGQPAGKFLCWVGLGVTKVIMHSKII